MKLIRNIGFDFGHLTLPFSLDPAILLGPTRRAILTLAPGGSPGYAE